MALSEDEEVRAIAESRDKLWRDIESIRCAAVERGREEGLEEMERAFVRKRLKRGRPIEEIMKDTGLPMYKILELQSRMS